MNKLGVIFVLLFFMSIFYMIPEEEVRHNILVVITDDQRWDTLWSMSELQNIASRGTIFTNAYTSTPLCCPARCSLLTGMYPYEAGVVRNSPPYGGIEYCDMDNTLFTALHDAGYRVGVFGKLMNGTPNGYIPPGVDTSVIFEGNGGYYNSVFWVNGVRVITSSTTYSTTYLAQQAKTFMDSCEADGVSCFTYFAPRASHAPMTPEMQDKAKFSSLTLPVSSINEDTSDKCTWMARQEKRSLSNMKSKMINQYRTLQSVDRALALLTVGIDWEQTVFIYLSDQGYFWGEHRLTEKGLPYQEALRIPLVVVIPGGAANIINPSMVITNDLTNLIKQQAGIPILSGWMGAPPLLTGALMMGEGSIRSSFFIAQMPLLTDDPPPGFIGIHTGDAVLIEYGENNCREFYNLVNDPYQITNQITNPVYVDQISEMIAQLGEVRGYMDGYNWTLETYLDPPGMGGRD